MDDHEAKTKELQDVAQPLIDFLKKYYHPHAAVFVRIEGAEVLEGVLGFNTGE